MEVVGAVRLHDVGGTGIVSVSSLAGRWSLQSTQSFKQQQLAQGQPLRVECVGETCLVVTSS